MTHPTQVSWKLPQWKQDENAQIKNPATLQKERCFNLLGKKVLCVQDEAKFKVTPGMLGVAALILYLVVKR